MLQMTSRIEIGTIPFLGIWERVKSNEKKTFVFVIPVYVQGKG